MTQPRFPRATGRLAALALLAGMAACSSGKNERPKRTPEVGYVVVQPTDAPLTTELAGRTSAYQSAEVRPQVTGIVRRRFFTEGAIVRQGQPLYQIDPSLYRASADQASANLSAAMANAEATAARAERLKPLAEIEAVAKQDYTDAQAAARQAAAQVAQTRAQLATARINLRFTTVPAPITGRIGRSLFTEGALVSANQADPLATIQRLDPIYVDMQQSSADLLALRRSLAAGGVAPAEADVRLKLEDGSDYPLVGKVEFTEVVVDPGTGTVTLRARFPNPQGLLLPGMFVRATFAQSVSTRAFIVPGQAVVRDPKGNASVLVVGKDGKVEQRSVTTDHSDGASWIVTSGLNPGDKVITQGLLQAKPGMAVKAVPASAPQRVAAPKRGK